jgi:hypothetical protein
MKIGDVISRDAGAFIAGRTPGVQVAAHVAAMACACWAGLAAGSSPGEDAIGEEQFALHGQLTYVEQETSSFHAPYAGANSLSPNEGRETVDVTLYAGARLWPGAEAWINGEIDQGFGLDGTLGVARVGKPTKLAASSRIFASPGHLFAMYGIWMVSIQTLAETRISLPGGPPVIASC